MLQYCRLLYHPRCATSRSSRIAAKTRWKSSFPRTSHNCTVNPSARPAARTSCTWRKLKGVVGVLFSWSLRIPGEKSYTIDFPRLLRLAGERRHEETEGEGHEKPDDTACMVASCMHGRVRTFYAPCVRDGNRLLQITCSNPYRRFADTPPVALDLSEASF